MQQEERREDRTHEAGTLVAIGTTRISEKGTIITRRECYSWAVPDGASDASRTKSENRSANPNSTSRNKIGRNLKNRRHEDKGDANEEKLSHVFDIQKNNQIKTPKQEFQIETCEHVSKNQQINLESSGEQAATNPWNIAPDFGRYSGESFAKLVNIMGHYCDAIRRFHSSSAVTDGGVDEPRQNGGHNFSSRHKQRVQKLGLRRSPMGGNASVLVYHSVAKSSVRGTDRLHCTDEHDNAVNHS